MWVTRSLSQTRATTAAHNNNALIKTVSPRLLIHVCVVGVDGHLAPWHRLYSGSNAAAVGGEAAPPSKSPAVLPNGATQRGGVAADETLARAAKQSARDIVERALRMRVSEWWCCEERSRELRSIL